MEKYNYIFSRSLILFYSVVISIIIIFYFMPRTIFIKEINTVSSQNQSKGLQEQAIFYKFSHPFILKKIKLELNEEILGTLQLQEIRIDFFLKGKNVARKIFNEEDKYTKDFLKDCFNLERKKLCYFYEMNSFSLYHDENYYLHISMPNKAIDSYIVSFVKKPPFLVNMVDMSKELKIQNILSMASWFDKRTNKFLWLFVMATGCLSILIYKVAQRYFLANGFNADQQKKNFEFTAILIVGLIFAYGYCQTTAHIDVYGGLGWDGANYFLMSLMMDESESIRSMLGANQHYARFLPPLSAYLIGFGVKESFLITNILIYLIILSLIYFFLKKEKVSFKYIFATAFLFSLLPLGLRYYINYSTLTDPLVNLSILLLVISIRYNYLLLYSLVLTIALLSKEIFITFPLFLFLYQLHKKTFRLGLFLIAHTVPVGLFIYFLYHPVFYPILGISGQDNLSDLKSSILPKNLILLFDSYASVFGVMFYIVILQIKKMFGYFKRNLVDCIVFLILFVMALQFSDRFKIWLLPFILAYFVHFLVSNKMNLFELAALIVLQIWLMGAFHAWSSSGNEYLARDSMRMTYEQSIKAFIFNMVMTGIFLAYMVSRNMFLSRDNVMKG